MEFQSNAMEADSNLDGGAKAKTSQGKIKTQKQGRKTWPAWYVGLLLQIARCGPVRDKISEGKAQEAQE